MSVLKFKANWITVQCDRVQCSANYSAVRYSRVEYGEYSTVQ